MKSYLDGTKNSNRDSYKRSCGKKGKTKEKESTLQLGGRCICFPVVFSVGLFTNLRRRRRRGATCTRITTISLSRSFFLYLFTYVFEGVSMRPLV